MFESLSQRTVIIGNSGAGKSALAESLAALAGTGEHFNKRSPLLDQSRSRLFEIVGVLFAHNCLSRPSLGRLSGAILAYDVVDKLMIVPKFGSVSV
jgi:energy-coupling factor transporter ATP-binding protein EcfA2